MKAIIRSVRKLLTKVITVLKVLPTTAGFMPGVWKIVFTSDEQEQTHAFGMEHECLQGTNKYSNMPLVWKVSVYTRTTTKFPGYLQMVAVIRRLHKT